MGGAQPEQELEGKQERLVLGNVVSPGRPVEGEKVDAGRGQVTSVPTPEAGAWK